MAALVQLSNCRPTSWKMKSIKVLNSTSFSIMCTVGLMYVFRGIDSRTGLQNLILWLFAETLANLPVSAVRWL